MYGTIGPFKSRKELDQYIPDPKLEYCAPLTARFAEWEKGGLMMHNNADAFHDTSYS